MSEASLKDELPVFKGRGLTGHLHIQICICRECGVAETVTGLNTERPLKEAKVQITKHLGQGGGAAACGGPVWLAPHSVHGPHLQHGEGASVLMHAGC